MKNLKLSLTILSIINVIRSSLLIAEAFLARYLIDNAVAKKPLVWLVILFLSIIIVLIAISIVALMIRNKLSLRVEVHLKKEIYDNLLKKDLTSLRAYHSGELSNIYLNDVNNINTGVSEIIPSLFLYGSRFVLAIAAIAIISYQILLVLLAIAVIAFLLSRIYSSYLKKFHKAALESDGKVNAFMQESYENIKMIKANDAETNFSKLLDQKMLDNYRIKNKRNFLSIIGSGGFSLFLNLISALAVIFGAYLISNDKISFGELTTLTMLVSYFEGPISGFGSLLSRYNAYKVSKARVDKLLSLPNDYQRIEISDFEKIEVKDLCFDFDYPIFKNLSFTFSKGETLIIKGPSGRGKSTLFNLLLGFLKPKSGELDVISNGEKYPLSNVYGLFSYVVQDNILFSGTVRENIALFVNDANEEKIVAALKTACIYDELMQKEKGLDTPLYERGGGLSLGQIQRILLAINLLLDKEILLLDEFTSSLDKNTENQIVNNLLAINKSKMIITHHDLILPSDVKILDLGEL